jgi:hypothetical protein
LGHCHEKDLVGRSADAKTSTFGMKSNNTPLEFNFFNTFTITKKIELCGQLHHDSAGLPSLESLKFNVRA